MRRFLVIAAIMALLAAPASVAAQPDPMTVDLGSAHLVAKVVVNVEVGFSCEPKPLVEYPWEARWGSLNGMSLPLIEVRIHQATGGHLQAFGETTVYFDPDVLCTGAPQQMLIAVVPDPSGPGFKMGTAAIIVSGFANIQVINLEDYYASYDVAQQDSTGWVPIKIGK